MFAAEDDTDEMWEVTLNLKIRVWCICGVHSLTQTVDTEHLVYSGTIVSSASCECCCSSWQTSTQIPHRRSLWEKTSNYSSVLIKPPANRSTPTPSLPPSLSPHPYFPIDDSPAVGMAALEPLLPLRSSRGWWWLSVLLEEKQDSVS